MHTVQKSHPDNADESQLDDCGMTGRAGGAKPLGRQARAAWGRSAINGRETWQTGTFK